MEKIRKLLYDVDAAISLIDAFMTKTLTPIEKRHT